MVRTVAASKEGTCQDSITHTGRSAGQLSSLAWYKYLPLPLLNVFFLSSYHKHLKQTTHYYKNVIPTTTHYHTHNNSTSLITQPQACLELSTRSKTPSPVTTLPPPLLPPTPPPPTELLVSQRELQAHTLPELPTPLTHASVSYLHYKLTPKALL